MDDTSDRIWLFMSSKNEQRGPISTEMMLKLVEKGVAVTANTLLWRPGMQAWAPAREITPFVELVEFQSAQWWYQEPASGQARGPVASALLLHKLRGGELDGLSLVYQVPAKTETSSSSDSVTADSHTSSWVPAGQVLSLRKALVRLEEQGDSLPHDFHFLGSTPTRNCLIYL
jgi:hypothetical protein